MSMAKEEQSDSIYEARDEKIVSPKDGKSTIRIGRFLKPCVRSSNQAAKVPNIPILSEIFPFQSKEWHSKVHFKGWRIPQKNWDEWLDRLADKYGSIWNQAGIFDAIMSSRYEIRCNRDLVLGLVEFWCPETNTFVFPWGEATITLEDVMILGGFPVLGEPVQSSPRADELVKIEKLRKEASKSSKAKKPVHSVWLKYFMEKESEFEHEAFLSLWLSRYVFPSLPEYTIGNHVFPIAGRLSRGTQIALAPAVLASLYHNLRLLKEKAVTSVDSITVLGLFQLVQLWAFERLPVLGPNRPKTLNPGEPRVARWHKLNSTITHPLIRCVLRSPDAIFQWRPYAADLKNWCHLSYYKENEQLVIDCSSLDEELRTFFQFLRATEVVGLDCRSEKYMPHRVAMQFGMDQELPGAFSDVNFTRGNVSFFIPPRSFEPGVSVRYSIWWKGSISAREEAIKEILQLERSSNGTQISHSVQVILSEYFNAFDATKTPKNCGRESSHVVISSAGKKSHAKAEPNYTEYSSEEEDTPPSPKFAKAEPNYSEYSSEEEDTAPSPKFAKAEPNYTEYSIEEEDTPPSPKFAQAEPNYTEYSSEEEDTAPSPKFAKAEPNYTEYSSEEEDTPPSPKFAQASVTNRKVKSELLDSHNIPTAVRIQENSQKKKGLAAVSPDMSETSSDDDDSLDYMPISSIYSLRVPRNNPARTVASASTENERKRKLSSVAEGNNEHTQKLGLEERIQKLEKLLGLKKK